MRIGDEGDLPEALQGSSRTAMGTIFVVTVLVLDWLFDTRSTGLIVGFVAGLALTYYAGYERP